VLNVLFSVWRFLLLLGRFLWRPENKFWLSKPWIWIRIRIETNADPKHWNFYTVVSTYFYMREVTVCSSGVEPVAMKMKILNWGSMNCNKKQLKR
jgi:hypothetical protein